MSDVDYETDEALHPFKGDEWGPCEVCGEYGDWHADWRERHPEYS